MSKAIEIDLRSDTVTKPTPEMRAAMAAAEVGDDVNEVDPTADRLQRRTAELLGKEDALFFPSGTMSNQVAVRIHCRPGDEFLCDANCHIFNYEQGAFAQLSGVVAHPIVGEGGVLKLGQLAGHIRPNDDHLVRTRLVCLENTHNRGAGRVLPFDEVEKICHWAHDHGLATHLDGARLFNAAAASSHTLDEWARPFDTVSVCFSKGLGAPVGSALVGPRELIRLARRHRKLFGGGMRQVGIICAGALYALDHHCDRLVEDHEHAEILAGAVRRADGLTLDPETVETNIVIFEVDSELGTADEFVAALGERGVGTLTMSATHVRAVTHLGVGRQAIETAAVRILETAEVMKRNK